MRISGFTTIRPNMADQYFGHVKSCELRESLQSFVLYWETRREA